MIKVTLFPQPEQLCLLPLFLIYVEPDPVSSGQSSMFTTIGSSVLFAILIGLILLDKGYKLEQKREGGQDE